MLEWGDPPKPRQAGYQIDWADVVKQLQSKPGQWAKIVETPTAIKAHNMRRNLMDGRYAAVPPGQVEVESRTIHSGRGAVWMRWLPKDLLDTRQVSA